MSEPSRELVETVRAERAGRPVERWCVIGPLGAISGCATKEIAQVVADARNLPSLRRPNRKPRYRVVLLREVRS